LFCVQKIEREGVDATFAQRARETDHERMSLRRTGAVREDDGGATTGGTRRRIEQRRRALAAFQIDNQRSRVHTAILGHD